MDSVANPYVPGAGFPPPQLVGRDVLLQQATVSLVRFRQGRASKSLMLVGLRGVGKTVLLNEIEQIAKAQGDEAILIEVPEDKGLASLLVPSLRSLLIRMDRGAGLDQAVKRAMRVFKGFIGAISVKFGEFEVGLDIEPERGVADSGDIDQDLPDLFIALGEAARARKTAIALIIDEVQYLKEADFSALIMAMHKCAQRQLPMVLIGGGLPQIVGLAGRSKSYSERLFDFPVIGPLSETEAADALQKPALMQGESFTAAALEAIYHATKGYPYFVQEWGYHAWEQAEKSPISLEDVLAATPTAISRLDQSFFRVRLDRLTPREKVYLRQMAEMGEGPHRSGDIAARMGVAVQSVAPLRSGLIKKGMVYSPSYGDTAFTVPLFDAYMKRAMPTPF